MYLLISYGVWTLFNLIRFLRSEESCFVGGININMINYYMLMLLGIFPLTALTLGLIFVVVLVGMVIIRFSQEHRMRH